MAITRIKVNEWSLDCKGRLIPRLHFDPVRVNGKFVDQLPAYNYQWVVERGLGVDAVIFIDVRSTGKTPYISYVNVPAIPNLQMFCECGILFTQVGRHLQCLEPENKCLRRGRHSWQNDLPINWVNASMIYTTEMWRYFRDDPNFFKPREV